MAEWLIENGIGETRALLIADGAVRAARLAWPDARDELEAGAVVEGRLLARTPGACQGLGGVLGTADATNRHATSLGQELLIDRLPPNVAEGAVLRLRITRAAIPEASPDGLIRRKRAHARVCEDPFRPAPTLAEALAATGTPVRAVRRFPEGTWEEVWAEAWQGVVPFAGGTLLISPTPAMTLIDIDGILAPRALALAAVPAIAAAIHRFDLAGAIGIDFPSLPGRADRRAVDDALGAMLGAWPHERTAMNGFGFVQIVARCVRPSLLVRLSADRVGAAARALLRRAEAIMAPGALLLTAHPAVRAEVSPGWEAELARRSGRALCWHGDATLALNGAFAQAVTDAQAIAE